MLAMTTSETDALPSGVVFDKRRSKTKKKQTRKKTQHELRLLFREPCPEESEVLKLHPSIRKVFAVKRPKSARYCILRFDSAEAKEEVRSALHNQKVDPYFKRLQCLETNESITRKAGIKGGKALRSDRMKMKHLKMMHLQPAKRTLDMRCNSTARELRVRYGVTASAQKRVNQLENANVNEENPTEETE